MMFKVRAGTEILVFAPFGKINGATCQETDAAWYHDTAPWKAYVTKEDRYYDLHEVIDVVAISNERPDVPLWAVSTVERGEMVLVLNGKYARVDARLVEYVG